MNGVRFYFDYGSAKAKRQGGDAPNALALLVANGCRSTWDAIAALTDEPNSPVCGTGVSPEYLREACKRVSQTEAYRVHPALKVRMIEDEARETVASA